MMITETQETAARYVSDFERFEWEASSIVPSWIPPLRKAAMSRFAEIGFPHRKDEEWRFTDIRSLVETKFHRASRGTVPAEALAPYRFDAHTLVFVNGKYAPELSQIGPLPKGVVLGGLAEALTHAPDVLETHLARHADFEPHAFVALNTAYLADGAYLCLSRNTILETPVHLLFVSAPDAEPTISHPRVLIVAKESSQVTVVESYVGPESSVYLTNAVTEVVLGPNAVVDHYKLNRESRSAYHVGVMQVELDQDSNFSSHGITLGGGVVRNEVNARFGGVRGECTLNGVYLADGKRLIDNHTMIDHALPHCNSHEVYKGILKDRAHGVFNGKIFVRQDAQKTDAKQTNQTLLLSREATIDTKPQLEIFADDVRCTHGATVGQLREEQVFYLRARGISEAEARAMLTYAFAADIINRIRVEPVRAQLDATLLQQLSQRA